MVVSPSEVILKFQISNVRNSNVKKYTERVQKCPKFEHVDHVTVVLHHKKFEAKINKEKKLCRVRCPGVQQKSTGLPKEF